jgi:hypothetical protein
MTPTTGAQLVSSRRQRPQPQRPQSSSRSLPRHCLPSPPPPLLVAAAALLALRPLQPTTLTETEVKEEKFVVVRDEEALLWKDGR